jgi:asparagine synthase (glutamine-hydrolysing)
VPVTDAEIRRVAPLVIAAIDEPFADSSLLPVRILSRAARSHVTVAFSGDGADELFAGYRRYAADRWLARWERVPQLARRRVLAPALRRLRDDRGTRAGEWVRRAHRVLDLEGLSEDDRALALARIFSASERARVAPQLEAHADVSRDLLCDLRARHSGRDALDTQLRVDLSLGLPDDMLAKVDRGSMACGLEVRVPYLDHRFVERAMAIPSALKRRGGKGKLALVDVFGAALPARVRRRSKAGFEAPLGLWLRGPLRELMRDTLEPPRVAGTGFLDGAAVTRMLDAHDRGEADHGWRIWSLMTLVEWATRRTPGPRSQ